jgi:hypothetical protein
MNTDDETMNKVQELVDSHLGALSAALDELSARVSHGPEVQAVLVEALLKWVAHIEARGTDPGNQPEPEEPIRSRPEQGAS